MHRMDPCMLGCALLITTTTDSLGQPVVEVETTVGQSADRSAPELRLCRWLRSMHSMRYFSLAKTLTRGHKQHYDMTAVLLYIAYTAPISSKGTANHHGLHYDNALISAAAPCCQWRFAPMLKPANNGHHCKTATPALPRSSSCALA